MRTKIAVLALAPLGVLLLAGIGQKGRAEQVPTWSEQVNQGREIFESNCAVCHDSSLGGGAHGPALIGKTFLAKWDGKTSDDLIGFTKTMMPPGAGGSLSDGEYLRVTAYMLSRGGHGSDSAPLRFGKPISIAPAKAEVQKSPAAQPGGSSEHVPVFGSSSHSDPAAEKALAQMFAAMAVGNGKIDTLTPVSEAMLTTPPPGDWLNWRRTRNGHGESPLDQVNTANVGSLKLAWVMALPEGTNEPTPIIHDGVMFIQAPGGRVQALDAGTGDFLWKYRYERTDGKNVALGPVRNMAIYGNSLFIANQDNSLVSIDARDGRELWRTLKADTADGFTQTAGPVIANGVLVSGINGCDRFKTTPCFISGHDPATGRELWRTATVAQPGEPGGDSWAGLPAEFRAGGDS